MLLCDSSKWEVNAKASSSKVSVCVYVGVHVSPTYLPDV